MPLDQAAQLRFPVINRHRTTHQRIHIDQRLRQTCRVIEIGHATRHPGPEIGADIAQNDRHTAGHILTPVGAAALDHHLRARVAHRETLTRPARCKERAIRGPIEHGIADDGVLAGLERRGHARTHHDKPARQAFANVIIAIAEHFQLQAPHRESPQRLPGASCQLDRQMVRLQVIAHPETAHDMAGGAGAHRAVRVAHGIGQLHLLAFLEEPRGVADDLGIQRFRHRIARLVPVITDVLRAIDGDQKRVEVQIIQMRRTPADLRQQIGPPDDLVNRTRAQRCQNLAHFLGVEGDQVHHLVSRAGEPGAQAFILRAHAHGAGVGLALPHHDAAHGDQGGGADAEFLGPHHRCHDNVAPRAQAPIGAQRHPLAQVVHRQNLMRLGQAHFPRQARVFDRGAGAGARPAVMAGNQDDIGLGLGHTRRNRPHTA